MILKFCSEPEKLSGLLRNESLVQSSGHAINNFCLFTLCCFRFLEIPAAKVSQHKFSWNPCISFILSGKCTNVAVSTVHNNYAHCKLMISALYSTVTIFSRAKTTVY